MTSGAIVEYPPERARLMFDGRPDRWGEMAKARFIVAELLPGEEGGAKRYIVMEVGYHGQNIRGHGMSGRAVLLDASPDPAQDESILSGPMGSTAGVFLGYDRQLTVRVQEGEEFSDAMAVMLVPEVGRMRSTRPARRVDQARPEGGYL